LLGEVEETRRKKGTLVKVGGRENSAKNDYSGDGGKIPRRWVRVFRAT